MTIKQSAGLILMVTMSFFLMCDMYITPGIISELTAEFSVSSVVLSWVSSGFIFVGAIVGIYIGFLVDKSSRKKLFIYVVLAGEIPCLMTGITWLSDSIWSFALLRMLTGIGVGGIYPLIFSLLSDVVSVKHRSLSSAFIDLAWGLGTIAGPMLALWAVNTDYGWRNAFLWAAIPNFTLITLFYFLVDEPKRGLQDLQAMSAQNTDRALAPAQEKTHFTFAALKKVLAKKSNRLLFLQGIPGSIPWGLFPFWLIVIFNEAMSMPKQQATYLWEMFGVATVIGGFFWAFIGDRLFQKNPSYLPILNSIVIAAGVIPMWVLFSLQNQSVGVYLLMVCCSGAAICVASANSKALLMHANTPMERGRVFSLYNLFDNIGKGLGPAIGGLLFLVTEDYLWMAKLTLLFWIITALIYLLIAKTIKVDVQQVTQTLKQDVG